MRIRLLLLCAAILAFVAPVRAQLTAVDVQRVVTQGVSRAIRISPDSVIAVTDREGNVLGVWSAHGSEPTAEQIATAVSKAGTAAFLSSNQNAFTSRTAGFIIQQHFPPGVRNAAPGPLVGVGLSNLFFSDINKFKGPDSVPLFSSTPGLAIVPVPLTSLDGTPGGIPLYKNGSLVGGVGVTGDGTPGPIPGFRDENPLVFIPGYDKDEDVALAGQRGFQPSSAITADNVFINGFALPYVGSSTSPVEPAPGVGKASKDYPIRAAPPPFPYPVATFGGVPGELRQPIIDDPVPGTIDRQPRLTASEIGRIINFAADRARTTRAGIRLPIGVHMEVFITVVNNPNREGVAPTVLGTFRTGEATLFSWDVAVQKARTALYYSSRNLLTFGRHVAVSTRTVGFLAQSHYPPGLDANLPGPLFGEQERFTFDDRGPDPNLPNGITIFPGGFPLYRNGVLIGAIGISGDGVDQDDIVGASGTRDFLAPSAIRADRFVYNGAPLPYAKFPRDPDGAVGGNQTVTPAPFLGRFANVSSRTSIQTGDRQLIAGFITTGTQSTDLIIRALGPSLRGLGASDALQDPTLTVYNGSGAVIATNDDWAQDASAAQLPEGLHPLDARESATMISLQAGPYTVVEGGKGNTGVGLIEVYDSAAAASSSSRRVVNVSSRGFVGTGSNVMIGGFIITGADGSVPVILRALGPSLARSGVSDALSDPLIELRDGNGTLVGANNDWKESQQAAIQATGIAPSEDREAAILNVLSPGAYTSVIRGATGSSGVGLFEAFDLR